MGKADSTNRDYHLHLVSLCIFSQIFNTMSLESRIMYDLHFVFYRISNYDEELDALSDEELEEKLSSIKEPWWEDMYNEVRKDHKLLEILYKRGCKLDDLKTIYEAQQNEDVKTIEDMCRPLSRDILIGNQLISINRIFSTSFLKSLILITLILSFFTCLIICIFESLRL